MFDNYDHQPSSPTRNKIDVELVLSKTGKNAHIVSEEEGGNEFEIHRQTARIVKRNPPYATFRMSERRAIEAGLA